MGIIKKKGLKMKQKKLEELKRLWLFGVQLSEFIKEENENFLMLSTKHLYVFHL